MTADNEVSVKVTKAGAKRLRDGHPWMYRQDVTAPPAATGGSIVRVDDERGYPVGYGFWAQKSPIAVRLLSRGPVPFTVVDLKHRVLAAVERRKVMFPNDDAYRAVHAEADLVPGLFADRFGEGLSVQLLSEGAEAHKDALLAALTDALRPRVIALRNDTSAREFEGLPRETRLVAEADSTVRYHEGENVFEIDLLKERKTGAFLDQRENHVRAGQLARGEALDTFSYHGGFAVALARRCSKVLAVDQDEVAAATARGNVARNGLTNTEVLAANAFDVLHDFDRTGRRFDTVVVDPPALAKRKDGLSTAVRAYHELNLRAMRILRPGGLLVTCSCSAKVVPTVFEEMLRSAAHDARRQIQVLERRGAGLDHPALLGLPETEYLKCFILRIVD